MATVDFSKYPDPDDAQAWARLELMEKDKTIATLHEAFVLLRDMCNQSSRAAEADFYRAALVKIMEKPRSAKGIASAALKAHTKR